jgi:hypothetical protein
MCSECPNGLFIYVCEVKATRFQPSTEVNCRIQVATDRQRSVADRRHCGGETLKVACRAPRIHVMGMRQKFGNVHVISPGRQTGLPYERLSYAEFAYSTQFFFVEQDCVFIIRP